MSRMSQSGQTLRFDRCGNNFGICDGAFWIIISLGWNGMCNLINKNTGYIEAGKGKIFCYAVN